MHTDIVVRRYILHRYAPLNQTTQTGLPPELIGGLFEELSGTRASQWVLDRV